MPYRFIEGLTVADVAFEATGKTLEEAKTEIQEQMFREEVEKKYKAWLEALRERSYIKVVQ